MDKIEQKTHQQVEAATQGLYEAARRLFELFVAEGIGREQALDMVAEVTEDALRDLPMHQGDV